MNHRRRCVLPGPVEPPCDVSLLGDPVKVRCHEVHDKGGIEPKGKHRQEERHHLEEELLLGVDRRLRAPAPDLPLLLPRGDKDHQHQHQVGKGISHPWRESGAGRA